MPTSRFVVGWAVILIGPISGLARAQAPTQPSPIQQVTATAHARTIKPLLSIPLDGIDAVSRERIEKLIKQPTLITRGAPEEFPEGIYGWLLDHPDRGSLAWRRLGIQCSEITRRGNDRFGWSDGQGTDVTWRTVFKSDDKRIWFAEGHTRLSPIMPNVPVRAVVVVNHPVHVTADGRRLVRHEADIYLQTDSKPAMLVARTLGPTMPRLAEQGAAQLLLFFSGLTRYFDRHPEDIATLLAAH